MLMIPNKILKLPKLERAPSRIQNELLAYEIEGESEYVLVLGLEDQKEAKEDPSDALIDSTTLELDLKPLPSTLKYVSLDANRHRLVIIAFHLIEK